MHKKLLSMVLVICIVAGILPTLSVTVSAADTESVVPADIPVAPSTPTNITPDADGEAVLTQSPAATTDGGAELAESSTSSIPAGPEDALSHSEIDTWSYPEMAPTTPFASGSGTSDAPYRIATAQELANLAYLVNNNLTDSTNSNLLYSTLFYELTADIALNDTTGWENSDTIVSSAIAWTPIGNSRHEFSGTFEGNNHTVSGIYIDSAVTTNAYGYLGLFGNSTGTILNIKVSASYINSTFFAGNISNDKGGSFSDMDNNNAADLSVAPPMPSSVMPNTDREIEPTDLLATIIPTVGETELTDPPTAVIPNEETELPALLMPNNIITDVNMMTSSDPTFWDGVMPAAKTDYAFGGGDGSELDPYLISTAADLAQLAANVAKGTTYSGTYFEMTANITLNENLLTADGELNISGTFYPWTPIGVSDTLHFAGNFDGNNHTIGGVYINPTEVATSDKYQGLFGYANGATINDIAIVGSYIQGYNFIGGVVGYLSGGKLNHCSNNGRVSGTDNIGGVAGYGVNVTILNCDNNGLVSGNGKYVGGIVGYNHAIGKPPSTVMNSRNSGSVTGSSNVGGVVGCSTSNISITNSSNSGSVSGTDYIGGVVGWLPKGYLENSWNEGSVSGENCVGGVVGNNQGAVMNCQNKGDISGNSSVGGVVGEHYGTVTNCQNSSSISGDDKTGGIVGYNYGTVQYCCNTGTINCGVFGGGIAGYNQGLNRTVLIQYCYNLGNINGGSNNYIGGVVGCNNAFSNNTLNGSAKVEYCYNAGSVKGGNYVGGLVGYNSKSKDTDTCLVQYCYNTGGLAPIYKTGGGGCVGYNTGGSISNCFYDKQMCTLGGITDKDYTGRAEGRLTSEMVGESLSSGLGETSIWVFTDSLYPLLADMDSTDAAYVSAAPLTLFSTGTDTYNTVDNVTNGFTLCGFNDVTWYCGVTKLTNSLTVSIDSVGITLTAQLGGAYKNITLKTATGIANVDVNVATPPDPTVWDGTMPEADPVCSFSGGGGSESDPYLISSAADLAQLSANVAGGTTYSGKYFKMMANIKLNENVLADDGTLNSGTFHQWTPIGVSDSACFAGSLNGNNHTVGGIYINKTGETESDKYQGLFGYVKNAVIRNTGVVDSYVKGYEYVGGIVGLVPFNSSSTVTNCSNTGYVNGIRYVGGVVGGFFGTIANCFNTGRISGRYVGGIAGQLGGTVTNCQNSGSVTGSNYVGGIAGYLPHNASYNITDCYNSGSINGNEYVGGVVGGNYTGKVINCINAGGVIGDSYTGGVVGELCNDGTVTDCHNAASVSGKIKYTGGIAGRNFRSTITNCHNSGSVNGVSYSGGVTGSIFLNYSTINAMVQYCYNTGSVSGNTWVGGVAGEISIGNECSAIAATLQYCYNIGGVKASNQLAGGVIGRLNVQTGAALVQYCYNAGNVNGGSGSNYIGGVVGSSTINSNGSATVQHCYNAGNINVGSSLIYVGSVAGADSGTLTGCFYDKQMCTVGGTNGADETGKAEGKLTSELVAANLSNSLGTESNWTFAAGLYPRLAGMENTDAAYVSATPVFLSNGENASAVTANFTVGTDNYVTWTSDNAGAINISDGSATVTRQKNNTDVILTADKNDISRTVNVTVSALPSQDKPSASIDYINEQLTGLVAGAGHKINGTEYTADENGKIHIGTTWFGTAVSIIKTGDGKTSVDSPAQSLNIPARPATTGLSLNVTKTDTAITIAAITGAEYSKDNGSTWLKDNVFTGLSADTAYNITLRYAATDSAFASDALESLSVRTNIAEKIKLQLTNITVDTKTYNKSTAATYTGTATLALKFGETDTGNMANVSLSGTPVITFSDANAGENKNVNVAGVSLTGVRAAFYDLDFSNLTGKISPKPVSLSWTDHSSFVYDNTEKSISAAVTNALADDAAEVTSYSGTISATDAGTYTAAAAMLSDSNYILAGGNGISYGWTIAAATPTITLTDKTVTKTGHPVTIDAAAVVGVAGGTTPDGTVIYTYYTDSTCTTPTYSGGENAGTAPVDVGTYYVKANIAASGNYAANTSQAATLTIKEQPVYSVSGTALNEANPAAALAGVTIRVMSGATQVGLTAITTADGRFVIYGIPSGTYNLVANYEDKTVTKIITVNSADLSLASSIVIPSIIRNSILVVTGTRTPDVVVGGLDTESDNTPAENSVIITLTVAENESSTNANDIIRTAASNGNKLGMILDIDLSKTVDGTSKPNYNETSALLEIIIPLPVELQGKSTYRVYRYHSGSIDTITTAANDYGEYITVNGDKTEITLYVKKFSTYAIGYTEPSHSTGHIASYTITATANKGGAVSPTSASVTTGGAKTFIITADEGYRISDVLVDGKSVGAVSSYTFSNVRTKHTIEAFFAKGEASWVCPFDDVDETDWFYSAVEYVNVNGLMHGTSETTFAPDLKTTRAMIVTILWRMEGQPEAKVLSSFTDVKDGAWYTTAIHWAAANEIVKGYDPSSFDPSGNITREQLATILYRYAQYKGYDVSAGDDTNILSYQDAFDISEYAIPAIQWACGAGLINGRTENTLVPRGNATRAETAAMLQRFGVIYY